MRKRLRNVTLEEFSFLSQTSQEGILGLRRAIFLPSCHTDLLHKMNNNTFHLVDNDSFVVIDIKTRF